MLRAVEEHLAHPSCLPAAADDLEAGRGGVTESSEAPLPAPNHMFVELIAVFCR